MTLPPTNPPSTPADKPGEEADLPDPAPRSQAERVIAKFGGARRLARLLRHVEPTKSWNPSAIYRWMYPTDKGGRGGVIPTHNLKYIQKAARLDGVLLTQDDLFPGDLP